MLESIPISFRQAMAIQDPKGIELQRIPNPLAG